MKKLLSSTKGKLEVKDIEPMPFNWNVLKSHNPKKKKDFLHPQTNILKTIYK